MFMKIFLEEVDHYDEGLEAYRQVGFPPSSKEIEVAAHRPAAMDLPTTGPSPHHHTFPATLDHIPSNHGCSQPLLP